MNKNEIYLMDGTNLEGFESRAMASLNDPMIMGQIVEGAVANIVMLTEGKDYWITRANNAEDSARTYADAHAKLYNDAKAALNAFLDTDPDDEIVEALEDVLDLFDISNTVEWSGTVIIKYSVSGTAPRGTSAKDIDSWISFDGDPNFKGGDYAPDGFEVSYSDYYDMSADTSID